MTTRKLGWSDTDYREAVSFGLDGDTINLSKFELNKPLVVRVVSKVFKRHQIWVPSIARDKKTNRWKESWFSVNVADRKNHFFSALVTADLELQRRHASPETDLDKLRSALDPTTKYLIAALIRNHNPDNRPMPFVQTLECPYDVVQQLDALRKTAHPVDPSRLKNGPIEMYDVVITAYRKENMPKGTPEYRARGYRVEPLDNAWEGKCPLAWKNSLPDDFDYVEKGVYTQAELETAFEFLDSEGLVKMTTPTTVEEVKRLIEEKPINLFAAREDGSPIFLYAPEIVEAVATLGLPYFEAANVFGKLGQLPAAFGLHFDKDAVGGGTKESTASEQDEKESGEAPTSGGAVPSGVGPEDSGTF